MSRIRSAALVVLMTTLTLSACGESSKHQTSKPEAFHSLTRTALITQADAICHLANARRDAIKDTRNTAIYLSTLAQSEQTEFAELAKLTPPFSMASDWKTIVSSGQAFAADLGELAQAAQSHDTTAMQPLFPLAKEAQERVLATTRNDGFHQCRQTSAHPADQ